MLYELVVIAKSDGAEDKVEKHLKDVAATNVKKESLGRKQLAYPIQKVTEAEYILWHFETEGTGIVTLNQRLRLEQELVLRYLITTFDPKKVSKAPKVIEVTKKPEEPKVRPKVTVTTKIVAPTKSQSDKEPKESKAKSSTKEKSTKVQKKGKK